MSIHKGSKEDYNFVHGLSPGIAPENNYVEYGRSRLQAATLEINTEPMRSRKFIIFFH